MIYPYRCDNGHTFDLIRKMAERDEPAPCPSCGHNAPRVMHVPHTIPDGVYSYAPNLGSEAAFARRLDAQRNGVKVYAKEE